MRTTKGKYKSVTSKKVKQSTRALTDAHVSEIARFFGVLSEPSRLKLLRALMERSMNVSELMQATGMKQGNVSKHLAMLLNVGVVAREQEGNFAHYSIADRTVFALCSLMCARVEQRALERVRMLG